MTLRSARTVPANHNDICAHVAYDRGYPVCCCDYQPHTIELLRFEIDLHRRERDRAWQEIEDWQSRDERMRRVFREFIEIVELGRDKE